MVAHTALTLLLAAAPPGAAQAAASTSGVPADVPLDAGVVVPRPIEPRVHEDHAQDNARDAGAADADRAPDIVVSAAVEPSPVVFGAPFSLVVSVVRASGVRVELPAALPEIEGAPRTGEPERAVTDLGGAVGGGPVDGGPVDVAAAPRVRETIRIPFLALDTAELKTPAFALRAPDGSRLEVPALTVAVSDPAAGPDAGTHAPPGAAGSAGGATTAPSSGAGANGLAEAEPALVYTVPDRRPWIVLGALGLVAGLVLAARKMMRLRRSRAADAAPPPPPPRPAHVVALERLDALLASKLIAHDETSLFVERLMNEVLRDYIAARFALSAGTRTTRELVHDLLGVSEATLDVAQVEALLADADLVKFARASLAAHDAHGMAGRVRAFVVRTALDEPYAQTGAAP